MLSDTFSRQEWTPNKIEIHPCPTYRSTGQDSCRRTVDPGFVNHRKVESILGKVGTVIFNSEISKIPATTPEWRKEVVIDHIYTRVLLDFCKAIGIKTLEESLLDGNGHLFCSNVKLHPCENLYNVERAVVKCEKFEGSDFEVELHLTTRRIRADTLKAEVS